MTSQKTDIKSMTRAELEAYIVSLGEKPFRAKQIYQWLHEKQAVSFEEMTNLSFNLRRKLEENASLTVLEPVEVQTSAQDGTKKYLFALPDGNLVESVFMRYRYGNSACISSQAGCRMGCTFCASAVGGLARNLAPAEMLEQIYRIGADTGERISHVVVMGTGEPLDNYENLLRFLQILTGEGGLHISQRNVTVSTCGLVPQIRKLAGEHLGITLAVSLHASSQEKREKLMPVAKAYPLPELLAACRYYFDHTGRRITFEYSLIAGVNDTDQDAADLAALLRGLGGHVNLIPVNPVRENAYREPSMEAVRAFQNKLDNAGINVTIRRELGRDIDGACGQLRKKHL